MYAVKFILLFMCLVSVDASEDKDDNYGYFSEYFSEGLYSVFHDAWTAASNVFGFPGSDECDGTYIPKDIADTLEAAFEKGGATAVKLLLSDKLDDWKKYPINIGITGNSGVGKSSFVNALRGLTADDNGAAEVGVVETTTKPKSYKHPNNENLLLWDLPGLGTPSFTKDTYLDKIQVNYFDYFIIMSATRFTENDKWLASELKANNKKFYFVRSKISVDIENDRKAHPQSHNKTDVLKTIRTDCKKNLQMSTSEVYLVDNYETEKYDFNILSYKLVDDAPELKKEAMLFSLNKYSEDLILAKKHASTDRIHYVAMASAVAGAIPIPGLDIAVDLIALAEEASFYKKQFGLTDEALTNFALKIGKSLNELTEFLEIESRNIEFTVKGIAAYMTKLGAKKAGRYASKRILKYVLPGLGSIIGGAASYANCYYTLESLLEITAKDALKVARYVHD